MTVHKKIAVCAAAAFLLVSAGTLAAQAGTDQRPDALAVYKEGDYTRAIDICEQELTDNPRNIESYVVLCWSLIRVKRYAEAEQRATQAHSLNRSDTRIVHSLAEAKFYLQKNTESLALFEEYVALSHDVSAARPRLGEAYHYMGELYIRMARYEHADIALTTAVRYEENNALWWTRLGYAREKASESARNDGTRWRSYAKAIEAYDKALTLNPNSYDALEGKKNAMDSIQTARNPQF